MAYKITGSILIIEPTQTLTSARTGSAYMKRDLVIAVRLYDPYTGEPKEDSSNTPKFTFIGERCRDLDMFKAGDIVTVDFDISGRSYTRDGKTEYAADIRPFRVSYSRPLQQSAVQQSRQPLAQPQPPYPQPAQGYQQQPYQQQPQAYAQQQAQSDDSDGLPF